MIDVGTFLLAGFVLFLIGIFVGFALGRIGCKPKKNYGGTGSDGIMPT
jgi:hypothetical protein